MAGCERPMSVDLHRDWQDGRKRVLVCEPNGLESRRYVDRLPVEGEAVSMYMRHDHVLRDRKYMLPRESSGDRFWLLLDYPLAPA